jgi:hypothetical protein
MLIEHNDAILHTRTESLVGASEPAPTLKSVVLPPPFRPVTAIRFGPRSSNVHGPSCLCPTSTVTLSSASICAAEGKPLGGRAMARGVGTSTLAQASSAFAAASLTCRSPKRRARPLLSSARSALAPRMIFGSEPLAAKARPALSRRSLASRWRWTAR